MERLQLTTEEQTTIDDFKSTYQDFNPDGLIYEGSNLVVDDHLQIDNSWEGVVLGGQGGAVWFCIPAWGAIILPVDLINYVTDRAGPNNETMPIFDEQQMFASATDATANPQTAAKAKPGSRRDVKEMLRDALKRMPKEQRKSAREKLRAAGVLGPDDKDDD